MKYFQSSMILTEILKENVQREEFLMFNRLLQLLQKGKGFWPQSIPVWI